MIKPVSRFISVRAFSFRRSVSFFCHFWQWSTKAFLRGWKSVSMKSITTWPWLGNPLYKWRFQSMGKSFMLVYNSMYFINFHYMSIKNMEVSFINEELSNKGSQFPFFRSQKCPKFAHRNRGHHKSKTTLVTAAKCHLWLVSLKQRNLGFHTPNPKIP